MNASAGRLPSRLVLLGHPVGHSLSPVFQNAALAAAGLALRYEAVDVLPEALAATLGQLRREDAAGNVTVPHKRAVSLACAHVTPMAMRAGAVNTFWFEDGRLFGDNTDVGGFIVATDELLGLAPGAPWPAHVAVLGAGGAARAVIVAAEERGVHTVEVHARTPAAAERLAAEFPIVRVGGAALDDRAGLVVNATPVGITGSALPIDPARLPPGAAVHDLVYRRGETAWVHRCREAGHAARDGLSMLVAQGALAFERFTGRAPDVGVMRDSLALR